MIANFLIFLANF